MNGSNLNKVIHVRTSGYGTVFYHGECEFITRYGQHIAGLTVDPTLESILLAPDQSILLQNACISPMKLGFAIVKRSSVAVNIRRLESVRTLAYTVAAVTLYSHYIS